jgi:hypothetical protein
MFYLVAFEANRKVAVSFERRERAEAVMAYLRVNASRYGPYEVIERDANPFREPSGHFLRPVSRAIAATG